MSGLSLLEKLRWALNERLCEQMRLLNSNFFDEVDDFLFTGGQHGQFIQDSVCLKSMREIRAKQELFEETFLSCVSACLQNIGSTENPGPARRGGSDDSEDAVYERVEVDLALKAMQRKAFKFYLPFVKRLENLGQDSESEHDLDFLQSDMLIENSVQAYSAAQEVFNLTLEVRLILLKLFERHFLMKMEKLYQDTISIINNINDEAFVEKLFSSSSSFKSRQTNLSSDQVQQHRIGVARHAILKSEEIEERISAIIKEFRSLSKLPKFIVDMIENRWRAIMFVIGLNNGVNGREFVQATQSVRNLVSLVMDPNFDGASADSIKEQLKKGFHLVQCPSEEQELFFVQLDQSLCNPGGVDRTGARPAARKGTMTSTVYSSNSSNSSITEGSVNPFAETVFNSDDLNELAGLLDNDSHTATATFDLDEESMTHHLALVDELPDGVDANYSTFDNVQSCRIYRSSKVDNDYQIKDRKGRLLLTRSRLGLAVSLREGELQLLHPVSEAEQKTLSPHMPEDPLYSEARQITVVETASRIPKA